MAAPGPFRPILMETKHSEPGSPTNETLQQKSLSQYPKKPFKKRVTLGYIPSKFTREVRDPIGWSNSGSFVYYEILFKN